MNDKKPSLLSRYEDPTGEFPNKSLQIATWYAKHDETLHKIILLTLIVWIVATLGSSVFFIGKYFIVDYPIDQVNLKNLSYSYVSPEIQSHFAPDQLEFSSPQIFSGITNRYDLVSNVSNPNTNWVARIMYQFEYSGGGSTESHEAVILPKEDHPLVVFGHESETPPSSATLRVLATTWERVDPHEIADPVKYIAERINISVDGFQYIDNPSSQIGSPIIQFSVSNNTVFDFWEFSSIVEFKRGEEVVGVSPLVISNFKGGETRDVSLGVVSSITSVDSVDIIPLVNVFDTEVYMQP